MSDSWKDWDRINRRLDATEQEMRRLEALRDKPPSTANRAPDSTLREDWTAKDGRSNSSELYNFLSAEVGQLIRDSAADLIAGRCELVGGLIMARLAHQYGLVPPLDSETIRTISGYEARFNPIPVSSAMPSPSPSAPVEPKLKGGNNQ
jgi:hypothetical protein